MPDTISTHEFIIHADGNDVSISFMPASFTSIIGLLASPPRDSFVAALDYFRNKFYPHFPSEKCPWHIHKEISDIYLDQIMITAIELATTSNNRGMVDLLKKEITLLKNAVKNAKTEDKIIAAIKIQERFSKETNDNLFQYILMQLLNYDVPIISWPMSWYWKSVFTGLPNWKKNHRELEYYTVRVSQIRKWMLSVMYIENEVDTNKYGRVSQKTLLRPPLFGESNRIVSWDHYYSLLGFEKEIVKAWEAIEKLIKHECVEAHEEPYKFIWPSGHWDVERIHEEQWYVLGRFDQIYHLYDFEPVNGADNSVKIKIDTELDLYPHLHNDLAIKKKCNELEIFDYDPNNKIENKAIIVHYPYDYVSIPTFQSRKGGSYDDKDDNNDSLKEDEGILLSSDSVCRAYSLLSELWNDGTAKSVLLIAPPGSGKELFSRSIHHFQNFEGPFIEYALSPSNFERNDSILFNREYESIFDAFTNLPVAGYLNRETEEKFKSRLRGLLNNYLETEEWVLSLDEPENSYAGEECKYSYHSYISDGLIFKAREGVLFIDEVDKLPDQSRSSLLRLLENDEFAIYGTSMIVRLKKWRPLYVFAGSYSRNEIFELKPKDFWTRIGHIIEVDHPLDIDDYNEQKRVARNYFYYFWMKHIPEYFKKSNFIPFSYKENVDSFFKNYYIKYLALMNSLGFIDTISCMFANEIAPGGRGDYFSIRNIRNVVSRVAYALSDFFLYNRDENSSISRLRNKVLSLDDIYLNDEQLCWFEIIEHLVCKALQIGNEQLAVLEQEFGENLRKEISDIIKSSIKSV